MVRTSALGALLAGIFGLVATQPLSFVDPDTMRAFALRPSNFSSLDVYRQSNDRLARATIETADDRMTIKEHNGGVIRSIAESFDRDATIYSQIRLDGPCRSACITITHLPPEKVCATPRAMFYIHRPYQWATVSETGAQKMLADADGSSLFPYVSPEAVARIQELGDLPITGWKTIPATDLLPTCVS